MSCRCQEIQAEDPRRHFKGCPLREPLPEADQAAIDAGPLCTWPGCHVRQLHEEALARNIQLGADASVVLAVGAMGLCLEHAGDPHVVSACTALRMVQLMEDAKREAEAAKSVDLNDIVGHLREAWRERRGPIDLNDPSLLIKK